MQHIRSNLVLNPSLSPLIKMSMALESRVRRRQSFSVLMAIPITVWSHLKMICIIMKKKLARDRNIAERKRIEIKTLPVRIRYN